MTNGEKEQFCVFAAALFAPPDGAIVDDLHQEALQRQIEAYIHHWGGQRQLSAGFVPATEREAYIAHLQGEYLRLFGPWEEKISLVESTYKPWTGDQGCKMAFASATGLIMGDHALHMRELYRRASLDVPEEYRSMPDHLVLELEFLALLYRSASDEDIERFIGDHFDWIPALRSTMAKAEPHPLYGAAVELLYLFIQNEPRNGKAKDHGQTKIH